MVLIMFFKFLVINHSRVYAPNFQITYTNFYKIRLLVLFQVPGSQGVFFPSIRSTFPFSCPENIRNLQYRRQVPLSSTTLFIYKPNIFICSLFADIRDSFLCSRDPVL